MRILLAVAFFAITSCQQGSSTQTPLEPTGDTTAVSPKKATPAAGSQQILVGNTTPQEVLDFSKTLIGTPYKYDSTDPAEGFDCSGFITYVFNHFNIAVPRTSSGFTNIEKEINIENAKPGDIILFTGTDSTIHEVGHMGILTSANNQQLEFIHSTSGKANGVTITQLNTYYLSRFVKVIRVFTQND